MRARGGKREGGGEGCKHARNHACVCVLDSGGSVCMRAWGGLAHLGVRAVVAPLAASLQRFPKMAQEEGPPALGFGCIRDDLQRWCVTLCV